MVEANKTGKSIVGVEAGRELLSIFGMTPIMRAGKSLATADVGAAFGKEFVDRAKLRLGVDLAVHWFDGKAFTKLSSTFGDGVVATQDELKSVFNGAALQREATLGGHPAALYVGQIKNYAGQPVAVSKSSRTPPNTRLRQRVRSVTSFSAPLSSSPAPC